MNRVDGSLGAILKSTDYYEIESKHVGARFAVWVTKPPLYDREDISYPAIYGPDGNGFVHFAGRQGLLRSDPINPIKPFIQVAVGYVGEDGKNMLAVRARDLLPPNEPLASEPGDEFVNNLVKDGLLDRAGAELYAHNLKNPAADKFALFLEQELHPAISQKYRVQKESAGLYGYSYGGLFAAYVAMRKSPIFKTIGAGSPGILPKESRVLKMYDEHLANGTDFSGYSLHMSVTEPEITAPSYYQVLVGAGTTEFMKKAQQTPLKNLDFSAMILPRESHATGNGPQWYDYLRTYYST